MDEHEFSEFIGIMKKAGALKASGALNYIETLFLR